MKKIQKAKLSLTTETIKQLVDGQLKEAAGGISMSCLGGCTLNTCWGTCLCPNTQTICNPVTGRC